MTAIRTSVQNRFETTLSLEMGPTDLTATVATTGTLTSPCYIVIEAEDDLQAEYMLMDGVFTGTTFVTTNISKRYLAGSAAGSNLTHPVGKKVWIVPQAQHLEDLHDRIEGLTHGGFGDLSADGHPQYALVDGSRAFTGEVAGISPSVSASLATRGYVDAVTLGAVPPGLISAYGGASAPIGYLLCDGAEVSRATYSDLFSAISTAYGIGNGTTTFDLPDLRQRFPLGLAVAGTGSTLGDVGGSIDPTISLIHSHTVASHTHDIAHSHADTIAYAASATHTHTVNAHTHDLNHNHGAVTSAGGSAHTHTGPSHTHTAGNTGGPSSVTGSNYAAGAALAVPSTTHTHDAPTTGSGGTGSTGSESAHTHSVDLPALGVVQSGGASASLTAAGGSHTHTKSGGVTDNAGSSGAATPGTDNQLSATEAVPNAPFLTVQFIIKT